MTLKLYSEATTGVSASISRVLPFAVTFTKLCSTFSLDTRACTSVGEPALLSAADAGAGIMLKTRAKAKSNVSFFFIFIFICSLLCIRCAYRETIFADALFLL